MLEDSRRIDELKWIVPVDFVWTADLRWHYINWWKTRKQRIRDKNVTTEGSSWWYSTIYLMLKNRSVLLTNWRSSDYQTCHKKQIQTLGSNRGLLKIYPFLLKTLNHSLDLQKWMNISFCRKLHWSKQAYHLHNFYQIPNKASLYHCEQSTLLKSGLTIKDRLCTKKCKTCKNSHLSSRLVGRTLPERETKRSQRQEVRRGSCIHRLWSTKWNNCRRVYGQELHLKPRLTYFIYFQLGV